MQMELHRSRVRPPPCRKVGSSVGRALRFIAPLSPGQSSAGGMPAGLHGKGASLRFDSGPGNGRVSQHLVLLTRSKGIRPGECRRDYRGRHGNADRRATWGRVSGCRDGLVIPRRRGPPDETGECRRDYRLKHRGNPERRVQSPAPLLAGSLWNMSRQPSSPDQPTPANAEGTTCSSGQLSGFDSPPCRRPTVRTGSR
jgi:hypothetical protein